MPRVLATPRTSARRQAAVPLLEIVDGATPTAHPASHPGTSRHTTVIVRVVGHTVTAKSVERTATCVLPRTDTGLLTHATSLATLGGPLVPLPRRPRRLKVASLVARQDARAARPRRRPLLLERI